MKKKKLLFLIVILTTILPRVFSQERTFKLNLEGKEFNEIRLAVSMPDGDIDIQGQTADKQSWTFLIPNNVYEEASVFFIVPDGKEKLNALLFMQIENGDTISTQYNYFSPDDMVVNAKFVGIKPVVIPAIHTSNNMPKTIEFYQCIGSFGNNTELNLKMKYPRFMLYSSRPGDEKKTDEEYIKEYISLVKEHPGSRYFISQLNSFKIGLDTKEYAMEIFNSFSDEMKESYHGKEVLQFIERYFVSDYAFENIELATLDGTRKETVIADTSKYTLVIFSASWCGPCHKIIPIYKEIHKDLQSKLNLVYLTIDEPKGLSSWKELMEKEQIPWRSLVLNDKEIKKIYNVYSIPSSLLVAPNGTAWYINVRVDSEKQKLYDL